ncbi:MAG: hypothetical protein HZA80_03150 [Candidatus Taylorbacteria bacterium]|nr:hypothetical protein [Candidatus Taylorbacteria bacterium]
MNEFPSAESEAPVIPDARAEKIRELRDAFLTQFQEGIASFHMSVRRLTQIRDKIAGLKGSLDWSSEVPSRATHGGLDYFLRQMSRRGDGYDRLVSNSTFLNHPAPPTFEEFIDGVFKKVHLATLPSDRAKHDDGIRFRDLEISGQELEDILSETIRVTEEERRADTGYDFDSKIIGSYMKTIDDQTLMKMKDCCGEILAQHSELKEATVGRFLRPGSFFVGKVNYSDKYLNFPELVFHTMSNEIGPDFKEVPFDIIARLFNEEVERRAQQPDFVI